MFYIIIEVGVNHCENLKIIKKLINVSKSAVKKVVKFRII